MSDEKHPLELKFEEAVGKPSVRHRTMSELVSEIENHQGMTKLFHSLTDSPASGRMLYLHPLDLFGREGRYQPPYFYFGECSDVEEGDSLISRALRTLQIEHKAKSSRSIGAFLDLLGIDEEKQGMMGQDLADAIVYALVLLFRNSPPLRNLIRLEDFNYKTLRSEVKDYSQILDEKGLEGILTAIFADDSSDPDLIRLIERLFLILGPLLTRSSIELLEASKISQSEIQIAYHQAALSFQDSLLKKALMSFDEYSALLNQLYLFGLIENSHTIFWCENCSKEKTSYMELHGSRAPSKMPGRKCQECNQPESFSSVFTVDSLLLEAIFGIDHFLGAFLAWTLKDSNLDTRLNVYAGQQEIDVLVGKALIECKTFRVGGRDETMRENLEQSVLQVKRQIKALENQGNSCESVIIFCNQPQMKDVISSASSKTKRIMNQNNVTIFSYEDISKMLELLKSQKA